jgi:hypothetical protein
MRRSSDLATIARAIQIAAERAGRRAAQAGETRSDRWIPGSPADDRIGRTGRPADQCTATSNLCAQGAVTVARSALRDTDHRRHHGRSRRR